MKIEKKIILILYDNIKCAANRKHFGNIFGWKRYFNAYKIISQKFYSGFVLGGGGDRLCMWDFTIH